MKKHLISSITLCLIALINLYFLFEVRLCDYNGTNWQTVIYSDGKGYYEYLRAAFINHNLGKEDSSLGFIRVTEHGAVIKFFSGTAIAYSPFFAIAYITSQWNHELTDGYSFTFQKWIAIAGYVYLLLGLFLLSRLLTEFGISDGLISLVLLLITYGTNLFYYSILEPAMSHVYAFTAITSFLYFGRKYFRSFKLSHLVFAAASFGLTIIIRPTNGIVIFMLPFLCDSLNSFRKFLSRLPHVATFGLITGSFVFIHMLFWFLQTGSWLVWSYAGEGFYWTKPAISSVLFSFNKGWFVYTPLVLISLIGFFPLWKKPILPASSTDKPKQEKRSAVAILITLFAAVYMTSSWWCWNYGDSFGMRPLIDFYALPAILLAVLLSSIKTRIQHAAAGFILSGILITSCIQTYQYYHRILQHYSMSGEKYQYIFLKTSDHYKNALGGNIDLPPFTENPLLLIHETKNDFSQEEANWSPLHSFNDPVNKENQCFLLDSNCTTLIYLLSADSTIRNAENLYVKVSLRRYEFTSNSSSSARFAARIGNETGIFFNYEFALNDFPDQTPGTWRNYEYAFRIRKQFKPYETIELAILNPDRQTFLIDNIEIRIYQTVSDN